MLSRFLGGLNVFGAASFWALAFFELDAIAFAKVFEISDYRCAVEEQIISSGSDEAEAFVCDDFLNGSLGHVVLIGSFTLPTARIASAKGTHRPVLGKRLFFLGFD